MTYKHISFSRTCPVARISLREKREHPNKQRQRRPKVTKGCSDELHKHKIEWQTKNQRKPVATTQVTNYMNELSDDRVEYPARNHMAASKHSSRASLASFLKVRALRSFQSKSPQRSQGPSSEERRAASSLRKACWALASNGL